MWKRALVFAGMALSLSSCHHDRDVKAAWNDVIKRCATSTLNGPNILFFGPTNAVGPGSVWRRDNEGVYRLRYDLSQMPDPKTFTAPYSEAQCDGTYSSKVTFGLEGNLDAVPVSAEAKADFARARTVSAKAESVAWVPIAEGPYENYVRALPANSGLRTEIESGNRLIMTRAFKVSGFTTSLTFSDQVAAELRAKYPSGPLPAGLVGGLEGGLNAAWSSANTLTLSNAGSFYIAGEFQAYAPTGLSSTQSPFGDREVIDNEARAQREAP